MMCVMPRVVSAAMKHSPAIQSSEEERKRQRLSIDIPHKLLTVLLSLRDKLSYSHVSFLCSKKKKT